MFELSVFYFTTLSLSYIILSNDGHDVINNEFSNVGEEAILPNLRYYPAFTLMS
jgi:hypothetical protein